MLACKTLQRLFEMYRLRLAQNRTLGTRNSLRSIQQLQQRNLGRIECKSPREDARPPMVDMELVNEEGVPYTSPSLVPGLYTVKIEVSEYLKTTPTIEVFSEEDTMKQWRSGHDSDSRQFT